MVAAKVPITKDDFDRLKDSIDRWRVQMQAEQDKQRKTIYGNGEPGLDELVRRHDAMLTEVKQFIDLTRPMVVFYKVGVWFASAIGLSVIALIWGMVTGTVEVVFP